MRIAWNKTAVSENRGAKLFRKRRGGKREEGTRRKVSSKAAGCGLDKYKRETNDIVNTRVRAQPPTFVIHYAHVPLYFNVTDDEPAYVNVTLSPLSISRSNILRLVLSSLLFFLSSVQTFIPSPNLGSKIYTIRRN